MIRETIITSVSPEGAVHIAPMGVHVLDGDKSAGSGFGPPLGEPRRGEPQGWGEHKSAGSGLGRAERGPKGEPQGRGEQMLILPFRPSTTLDNILATRHAIINYCDDVRIFAGCLTGRRDWPLVEAERVPGKRLAVALAHAELELARCEDDQLRPRLFCRVVHETNHAPFRGFNRAQFSVLEAAILVSRLHRLPWRKIESELTYLRIGLDKTAGEAEREAWGWLMEKVEAFRREHPQRVDGQ